MALTRGETEKTSLLARLILDDAELDRMTERLGAVLGYMDQLAELNTDDVEPLAHPGGVANVFRPDEVRPSLPREAALANAPKSDGEHYRVPAVLGE
ncbi:MAG: Asp-tRNA(Asn)/Glu-tRNA(Gln) amidotransferase subunit GatC [Pirellulales bacterium]